MDKETVKRFNTFRSHCLTNAENSLNAAESLAEKNLNHIAYHLSVLCLEEIGKVFLGWCVLTKKDDWGKDERNIPIDDHVKKLFWAIWGPTFGSQTITNDQVDQLRNLATVLHEKRLNVLYTDLDDEIPSSQKISNDELRAYLKWAKARLELAKVEGDINETYDSSQQEEILWFAKITDDPIKRGYIFGDESQGKLTELGNINDWLVWLREKFDQERKESRELIERELARSKELGGGGKRKWKLRLRLVSQSHSIRANVLNSFNEKSDAVKLSKRDVQTLIVDLLLSDQISIQNLWHHGLIVAKTFVGALNVGTNGFVYWNVSVDTAKYYDKIWDLENNKQLLAVLATDLKLDWRSQKLFLTEENLHITSLTFNYFSSCLREGKFSPIDDYLVGLSMLSKTDVHLRMEPNCFFQFYSAFRKALMSDRSGNGDFSVSAAGYQEIGQLLADRKQFDAAMEFGAEMIAQKPPSRPITLTDVIAMKNYCGHYFVTLALRWKHNSKDIKLVLLDDETKSQE